MQTWPAALPCTGEASLSHGWPSSGALGTSSSGRRDPKLKRQNSILADGLRAPRWQARVDLSNARHTAMRIPKNDVCMYLHDSHKQYMHVHRSIFLSFYLSIYLYAYLPVNLTNHLPIFYLHTYPSIYLSVHRPSCLYIYYCLRLLKPICTTYVQ